MKCYCDRCCKDVVPVWADTGIDRTRMEASCPVCDADLYARWEEYIEEADKDHAEDVGEIMREQY